MSCQPEQVTALVDGALVASQAALVDQHLAACPACRALSDAERAVRRRLQALPAPEPPSGLETRLRSRLRTARWFRPAPGRLLRLALPLAAVLALALWARGVPAVVAWELANDHRHCYSYREPPASVRSARPAVVAGWFAQRGTPMPSLPAQAGGTRLLGGRYCYFPDLSAAPHVFYGGGTRPLSVFVLAHDARFGASYATTLSGRRVALLRLGAIVVGVVGEEPADVDDAVRLLREDGAARTALASLARGTSVR